MARKELSLRDVESIIRAYELTDDAREARELKGDIAGELVDLDSYIALEKHEGRDGSPLMKKMQKKYDTIEAMANRAFGRGWYRRMGRGYESQIRRSLTASDRSALIRLASTLPKGSPERRAILAGLKTAGPRRDIAKAATEMRHAVEDLKESAEKLDRLFKKYPVLDEHKERDRGTGADFERMAKDILKAAKKTLDDAVLLQSYTSGLMDRGLD